MYAVKLICDDAKASSGHIVVKKGIVAWLRKSDYFPTFGGCLKHLCDLIVFDTYEEAEKSMEGQTPMPWFYKLGTIEIVKVKPIYKQVLEGYSDETQ